MPPNANCWDRNSKRFDFGVPLEDVFPPNDIHPRLKYLFEEAYRVSLESGLTIDEILRHFQGPLEIRLKLKEKVIYDVHYHLKTENIDESPGAYFWAIRHFLGLLPVPLLPEYAQEMHFDWIYVSEKCHRFLRHYENERKKICQLDYEIAEHLNLLPFEHFLLLSIIVIFIRKISMKSTYQRQISRKILLCLAKYYCAAIGSRPYRPGQNKNDKIFPLFFYILLRWRFIEKNCRKIGHPAYFLETDCLNFNTYRGVSIRDSSVQTAKFSPEIITVYRNVPYICNNNNYLKDSGCQTELSDLVDIGMQNIEITDSGEHSYVKIDELCKSTEEASSVDIHFVTQVNEETYETFEKLRPVVESSPVDVHAELNEAVDKAFCLDKTSSKVDEKEITGVKSTVDIPEQENTVNPTEHETAVENSKIDQVEEMYAEKDLSFPNCTGNKDEWSDIINEAVKTVKKVEEYLYDDYETFSKEDYNQISTKNNSSLFDKISRIGWTYTPKDTKNSCTEDSKSKLDDSEIFYHQSYFKFEDVFEPDGSFKENDKDKGNSAESTYTKDSPSKTSKVPLCDDSIREKLGSKCENGTQSKKSFSLKRFKINLDFLRVLTPKTVVHHTPSYHSRGSNVKYKRIKNVKSNTF